MAAYRRHLRFCRQGGASTKMPRPPHQFSGAPRGPESPNLHWRHSFFLSTKAAARSRKSASSTLTPTPTRETRVGPRLQTAGNLTFGKRHVRRLASPRLPVHLKGTDPRGHPFAQTACTSISARRAHVSTASASNHSRPDPMEVRRLWRKAVPRRLDWPGWLH